MGDYVFVCYAREDEDFVLKLAANLKSLGDPIWLDQWDIPTGDNWDRKIEEALRECTHLLLILSPASVKSVEVVSEWCWALKEGKVVVPILYQPCEIPFRLRSLQYIDLTSRSPDNRDALDQIQRALIALILGNLKSENLKSERSLEMEMSAPLYFGRKKELIEYHHKALDTVNFTAYYPRICVSGRKYGFAVYAHLPELQSDVNSDAQKFSDEFGDIFPRPRHCRSNVKLDRGTLIKVVLECIELKFDPIELTKKWDGGWTRFLFDFEAEQELVGEVISIRISIQVAGIEIACINNCAIEVMKSQQRDTNENPLAHAKLDNKTSNLYQKIFISYSRHDQEITERYKLAQIALGNEAFIDVDNLRTGENWMAGLAKAIDVADVFQLFWSGNSANSEYCRYEWTYALKFRCPDTKCEGFIRPVYWRKPMPDPPPELSHLNFKYVPFGGNA
jgi:hypothetical protein